MSTDDTHAPKKREHAVGTRKHRVRKALYYYWTRDLTKEEIGDRLGVSTTTVDTYLHESPQSEAVREQLDNLETKVRYVAVEQLREQLKAAGSRAESAEKPVKIWEDDDGNLIVRDKKDDAGNTVDKFPVPAGMEMAPDQEQRFYGRSEAREILDLLTDIVGGKAAERHKHEVTGEGGGPIQVSISETVVESGWTPPDENEDDGGDDDVIDIPSESE